MCLYYIITMTEKNITVMCPYGTSSKFTPGTKVVGTAMASQKISWMQENITVGNRDRLQYKRKRQLKDQYRYLDQYGYLDQYRYLDQYQYLVQIRKHTVKWMNMLGRRLSEFWASNRKDILPTQSHVSQEWVQSIMCRMKMLRVNWHGSSNRQTFKIRRPS